MTNAPLGLDSSALLAEWSRRVRANREQAEAYREGTVQAIAGCLAFMIGKSRMTRA